MAERATGHEAKETWTAITARFAATRVRWRSDTDAQGIT